MKTIWEVIMVMSILLIGFGGLNTIGVQVFTTQELDEDSLDQLSQFSTIVDNYTNTYDDRLNTDGIDPYLEPDLNDVDGFVQEYRDYKGKVDQLKDGLLLVYRAPDLILYVVPFVDVVDLESFANIYRVVIWVLLLLLIIVGLRNGQLI